LPYAETPLDRVQWIHKPQGKSESHPLQFLSILCSSSITTIRCLPPTRVSRRPPVFPLVLRSLPLLLLILLTLLRLQLGLPLSPAPLIRPRPVWEVSTLALRLITQAARIRPRYPLHQIMCLLRYLIPQRVSTRQHQRERSILLSILFAIWVPRLPRATSLPYFSLYNIRLQSSFEDFRTTSIFSLPGVQTKENPLRLKVHGGRSQPHLGFGDPITSVLASSFLIHMSTYVDTNSMLRFKG
jgi:hypothetical protein